MARMPHVIDVSLGLTQGHGLQQMHVQPGAAWTPAVTPRDIVESTFEGARECAAQLARTYTEVLVIYGFPLLDSLASRILAALNLGWTLGAYRSRNGVAYASLDPPGTHVVGDPEFVAALMGTSLRTKLQAPFPVANDNKLLNEVLATAIASRPKKGAPIEFMPHGSTVETALGFGWTIGFGFADNPLVTKTGDGNYLVCGARNGRIGQTVKQ